ncbi:Arf-GAP with SH3 domain, ANK repeat and PH domain-containing protein 1 [Acipenser ruthenus]|uniref:Arf-GAP with SH3 domain, ANK repeat and PH domain-containing protein 1 n=1 Tax=Acipenser ruthenus TaxID=7906 RepID=A0A662YVL4_ACIRT|nr:Arf-GAP with SH3 domain, ANK repeat and PH domain-containing protein 1 [Acipenser ruthenus]
MTRLVPEPVPEPVPVTWSVPESVSVTTLYQSWYQSVLESVPEPVPVTWLVPEPVPVGTRACTSDLDSQSKQGGYSMHQLQGNKEFGSEKKGYLSKKSDGLRKVWQRRKCCVKNGILTISHATSNRQPVKLNLLTCQVKPSGEDKKCFDLISHNRTYHFQAEDEQEFVIWISVLTNNKEEALNMAFRGEQSTGENSLEDLTKAIIEDVLRMPGNEVCCDCGAQAPPGPVSTLPLGTQPPSGSSTLSKKRPPPPPPGHKRTLSDPPSPLPHGSQNKGVTHWGNDPGPASTNKTSTGNKFEGIPQQQSTGTTKSTLGPRVLPKLPQKVTLRKIDTIHHPSIEKPSQPPEVFQKSPQPIEIPQKPQLGERPQSVDLPPKPLIGDLPLKPGELPPKPQLSDLPPKPQLGDLPPKPQVKDLPPKPQLTEVPPKPQSGESLQNPPPLEVAAKPQPVEIPSNLSGDAVQNQPSEDTNGTAPCLTEMPVPLPRKINAGKTKVRRVKTIYDCQADNDDELTFVEGEVIIVTGEEDQEWWVSVPVKLLTFI